MNSPATLIAFLSASIVLAITPGPGILYVLTRSLAGGRREGILSSLGTFVGGLVHVVAAALGLSAVLATSAVAYQAIRWAGALYLVYLGIKMFRSANQEMENIAAEPATGNPFTQGILTEILNPKTALFFLSFIPQFVNARFGPVIVQFLILGSVSVMLNTSVDVLVAVFAGPSESASCLLNGAEEISEEPLVRQWLASVCTSPHVKLELWPQDFLPELNPPATFHKIPVLPRCRTQSSPPP